MSSETTNRCFIDEVFFCQMPWVGVGVGLSALRCPTVLTQWFHCCRGKTLGLQIGLLPWSWRRYQVRHHQKGGPCSQWLPRWEEPLQKPTSLQPSPSPVWATTKFGVSLNWPLLSDSSFKLQVVTSVIHIAALWGIKAHYLLYIHSNCHRFYKMNQRVTNIYFSPSKSGQENFPINVLHLISSSSSAQTAYECIS